MKSGTTGLFFDLGSHPRVFLPMEKEPHGLCDDAVLSEEGKRAYAKHFAGAAAEQLAGDASTGYTKRPDRTGAAGRAKAVLADDFRAIYIVRDPISRIISQHYHEYSRGMVGPDINAEVREHSRYVDFSRYHWQLSEWIEAIGTERIHVVYFENYKAHRDEVVAEACRFLDLDPVELPRINETEVFNASENKPVPGPLLQRVRGNWLYKSLLRPLVSNRARHHLRKYFVPKAPPKPPAPTAETVAWLEEQLEEDSRQFQAQWGPAPWKHLSQAADV